MVGGCGKAGDVRKIERIQITRCVEGERERERQREWKSKSGWRIARETDGGVGWLCLKSKVDEEEAGDELAERTGERERERGRERESPQNENGINTWRQVCAPGPTCVFPCLGRPNT